MRLALSPNGGYIVCCTLCKVEIKGLTCADLSRDQAQVLCPSCFKYVYQLITNLKELK